MTSDTRQTGAGERISYGLYFIGQLFFYTLVANFLQLYLTDTGIPALVVGGVFIVVKVWDAINDPVFGVIVDRVKLKKGKFVPWVRLSTFLIPAATILLFAIPPDVSVQVKTIWAVVGYILWDTSYTFCDVPIYALSTVMTPEIAERDRLLLRAKLFGFVGGILAYILIPLLYPAIGWTLTAVVLAVLGIATMAPIGRTARERVAPPPDQEPTVGKLLRYLVSNRYLLIICAGIIIAAITNTANAVLSYVAIYCLGGTQWITLLAIITVLPALVAVPLVTVLLNRFDKITLFLISLGGSLVWGLVMWVAGYGNIVVLITLSLLRSLFSATMAILFTMMTADMVIYGHFKTGERAEGVTFSIQTFCSKIIAAVSGAVAMFVLGIAGFVSGEGAAQTGSVVATIWFLFTASPAITGCVTFLLMLFGYRLKDSDIKAMARANSGEITHAAAEALLTRRF